MSTKKTARTLLTGKARRRASSRPARPTTVAETRLRRDEFMMRTWTIRVARAVYDLPFFSY